MQIAFSIKGRQVGLKLDSFPSMLLFVLAAGAAVGACFLALGIAIVLLAILCIALGGSLIALGIGFIALILAACIAGFILWLVAIGLKRLVKECSRFFNTVVLQNPGTPPQKPGTPPSPGTDTQDHSKNGADSTTDKDLNSSGNSSAFTETTYAAAATPA